LKKYIYGDFKGVASMRAIGLEKYLELGDFGGSSLLQTEAAIRENVRIICNKAVKDNVRYLEVRCSPANYTNGGLSLSRVISIIRDEFKKCRKDGKCIVNLIIIATRSSNIAEITQEVAVAVVYATENRGDVPRIVGFDLAGR
jgi:adenosine deaminase